MKFALRLKSVFVASILGIFLTSGANAADSVGPAEIAAGDKAIWPEPINETATFDKASRATIRIYFRQLSAMQKLSDAEILSAFKIKSVNHTALDNWITTEKSLTIANYQAAAKTCQAGDWTCSAAMEQPPKSAAKAQADQLNIPAAFADWAKGVEAFTQAYIGEQMRLAALFPKVTSEIDIFSNIEWTGSTLNDRQFYLTFDDGPTAPKQTTDATLDMLADQHKSAAFFVLGNSFNARQTTTNAKALQSLYGNQCVALHGWEHQSHAKWDHWEDSIRRTRTLVQATIGDKNTLPLFRPPYGQRRADSSSFFAAEKLKVALWNIDSQDWNAKVDANAVEKRIILLMLIKRHGVILFHDTHPKAKTALPRIFAAVGTAVTWEDCHKLLFF